MRSLTTTTPFLVLVSDIRIYFPVLLAVTLLSYERYLACLWQPSLEVCLLYLIFSKCPVLWAKIAQDLCRHWTLR